MRSLSLFVALAAGQIGFVHAADEDRFCTELSQFVNATPKHGSLSASLSTLWGFDVVDGEEVLGWKGCKHSESPPEKKWCAYWLEHSSMEFPEINLNRALACLGSNRRYRGKHLYARKRPIKFVARKPPTIDATVKVEVWFFPATELEHDRLLITTRRQLE